ncbi:hypothetical protein GCM10022200_28460 [Microbacterium awajiense]|uniref:Nucleotidyltransferase n=1 Tax=Microbacterium awajiense TaxID=415214 RepID=A0ABP7AYJ5_9MICO
MSGASRSDRFAQRSDALARAVRATDGLVGLALLGSAAEAGSVRRDEWSDHDFFAITARGAGARLRPDLTWLPEQDRLVLTAREGEIGFVAVYDDGHVFEFALSDASELADAVAGEASVVVDDESGTTAQLIEQAQARAAASDRFDPANDARLVLVKLLIGVGRSRRGERLNGNGFVRQWAPQHLVRAIRGRFAGSSTTQRDTIDPMRRFERDFPQWGGRLADLLDRPLEESARGQFLLLREVLEPGWADFPVMAADVVARRLGW